jgi:hypothetical protein
MRSALFWDVMQRRVIILDRCFGTNYRSHLQGSRPLKMRPIGCPETSVKDYQSTLCNIPEERRSHQHRDGNLKSRIVQTYFLGRIATSFPNHSVTGHTWQTSWTDKLPNLLPWIADTDTDLSLNPSFIELKLVAWGTCNSIQVMQYRIWKHPYTLLFPYFSAACKDVFMWSISVLISITVLIYPLCKVISDFLVCLLTVLSLCAESLPSVPVGVTCKRLWKH